MSDTQQTKAPGAPRKSARKTGRKAVKPEATPKGSAAKPARSKAAKAKAPKKAKPEAQAQSQASSAPRILFAGSETVREDAAALGFDAVLISPLGPVDRPVRDVAEKGAQDAVREAASSGLKVLVDIPWLRHSMASPLLREQPGWFEPGAGTEQAAADPRQPGNRDVRRVLAERPELHEALAQWIAGRAAPLFEAGAAGVRIPDLQHGSPSLWQAVVSALRAKKDDACIIGDGLGGAFSATQAADGAGFDYLLDSGAWWDGRASWFLDQRDALSTRTIGFPEAPEGDDLAGRAGSEDLAGMAARRTARAILSSEAVLVPQRLIEKAAEGFADALRSLLALRAQTAWLDEKGPLLRAGSDGALLRTDTDPRFAGQALALAGPSQEGDVLTVASARFDAFEPASGTGLLRGETRTTKHDKAPPDRAAAKTLEVLAHARVAVESIHPVIDGGRFPAKRIVGDRLVVGADIFADGHDILAADILLTEHGDKQPSRHPMNKGVNDRWSGEAVLHRMGRARFEIEAWRDLYASWLSEVQKKQGAGQNIALEAMEGRSIVLRSLDHAKANKLDAEEKRLAQAVTDGLEEAGDATDALMAVLTMPGLKELIRRHGERNGATRSDAFEVVVDRRQARFSSWYEMFPRSQSGSAERHGNFDDVIAKLPYVKDLGYDVLYFPPIHPIGRTNMKGKNNTLTPDEHDVGSPYAIGSEAGGHDAIHPELGTLEDFDRLVKAAAEHGLEIALDFAIQCSPDHPWLKEHPEWFDWRPDGTIKYAENPPKKYEDIVNVHFYRDALPSLWYALRDVVLFWCERGVRIFRVDNPHTKPYPFWEWMIAEVKARFPDALFLSEAFTRPKVMKRLAKLGFTQSYTYYTWRNTKHELTEYVRELTETDTREVMNPNFFVNTPDINPIPLQTNNRAAHIARTWLAGTLASSYGLYNGIEIVESTVLPGKEEYLDSEKYEIRVWDMDRPGHIKDDIRLLNRLRMRHPALQDHVTVRFLTAWNDQVIWFAKRTPDLSDYLLFAVTFDYERERRASCELPLWEFGLPDDGSIAARDLVSGNDFTWHGKMQDITLGPDRPYAAFQLFGPRKDDAPALYDDLRGEE